MIEKLDVWWEENKEDVAAQVQKVLDDKKYCTMAKGMGPAEFITAMDARGISSIIASMVQDIA